MKSFVKKTLAMLLLLALMFSLAACGKEPGPGTDPEPGADPEAWVWDGPKYDELWNAGYKCDVDLSAADGKLAEILEKGKLVIGTSPDYPPMEGVDLLTGDIVGAEILLAKYIADSLGVELQIETMDFDSVLVAVATGKVDLGVSGFGYKADRAESYELSIGYQSGSETAHHTIAVRAEDADKYKTLEDFNKEGLVIDAQSGSLQEMYCTDQLPNAKLELVTSLDQAILDLLAKKVDAVAFDSTTALNYQDQTGGQIVSVYDKSGIEFDLSIYADVEGNVLAARKGEISLIEAVNAIIEQMLTVTLDNGKTLYDNMYYAGCDISGVNPGEE